MNERTLQLYKQALDFAHTTAGEDAGKGTIIESLTAGKFAELIVAEAITVLQKRFMGDLNREDMEVRRCIADVKKHFGDKE